MDPLWAGFKLQLGYTNSELDPIAALWATLLSDRLLQVFCSLFSEGTSSSVL